MKFLLLFKKFILGWLFSSSVLFFNSLCYGANWRLGTSNELILDEKEFFPIGIYCVNPSENFKVFKELKAAGFNTIQTYKFEANYLETYLRKTAILDLKALIFPGVRIEKDKTYTLDKAAMAVNVLKGSSAILAWQLVDEPDINNISHERINELRARIHIEDQSRPTALVVENVNKYKNYTSVTDIMMVDPYPIPNGLLTKVSDAVDKARLAVEDMKPVWVILQIFGYQDEKHKGYGRSREPTIDEVRCMTYLSIVHGVKGIFYFAYYGSQYDVRLSPKHWEGVKKIAGELRYLTPILLAQKSPKRIKVGIKNGDQSAIHYSLKEHKDKTYLIAVNVLNSPVRAIFSGFEKSIRQISVEFEGRNIASGNGGFSDDFTPYAVHVYRIR